jgi:hypothetical protein
MQLKSILCSSLLCLLFYVQGKSQISCNPSGNLWVYSNYDGGVLNINVDVNQPNIKIGVCTYEPVTINITGAFAGNVTEVRYAGYVSTNNFHCNNSPATTTITGVPSNITSVNYLPPSTLSNPNGYTNIVCAYSCNTTNSQGGCNTADQIKAYFQTSMGGTLVSYFTQYGCWSTTPYALSAGGNCCNSVQPCAISANAGTNDTICPGGSTTLSGSSSGGTTYSWAPSAGLSNSNIANPVASPSQTTTYVLTVTDGGVCAAVDSVTIHVASPQATLAPLPEVCEGAAVFMLTGASPSGGSWTGNHVSNGMFDPVSAGPGVHGVTYSTVDANGCTALATGFVVVNAAPVVSMSSLPPFCLAGAAYTMANGLPSGGSYAGPGIANGMFFPSLAGLGNHTMQYAYSDTNGCGDTVATTFTVIANPSPATITQVGLDSLLVTVPGDSFTWYLNGNLLITNGPSIQVQVSGTYTVVVWQGGCPSEPSSGFAFEAVALDASMQGLRVWPNPVEDLLHVQLPAQTLELKVWDASGRLVLPVRSFQDVGVVQMRGLPSGTYWLEITTGQGRSILKVLKAK